MYSAFLLNQYGLLKHLHSWLEDPATADLASEFAYRTTSVLTSIERMHHFQRQCIEEYHSYSKAMILDQGIIFWSQNLSYLIHELSPAITNMVLMQDLLIKLIINRAATTNVRDTFPSALKKDFANMMLEQSQVDVLKHYWVQTGSKLRAYRVLDQHYYAIIKHSYIQAGPDEKLRIILPDHPEQKNTIGVSFEDNIDAIEFCTTSFKDLENCFAKISKSFGIESAPIRQKIIMSRFQESTGKARSLALIVSENGTAIVINHKETGQIEIKPMSLSPN